MGRTTNKQRRAESQQTARERAAAMRVEQQRRERRRRMMVIGGVTLGLLAIVGAIIGISLGSGGGSSSGDGTSLSSAENASLSSIPATTFNSVGAASGVVQGFPQKTPPGTPPLTSGSKAKVLFIGAEFCPYCAADRWGLAVALKRFGTLSGLKTMSSSSTDVYPNTPTLTFTGAQYSSKYLALTAIENEDRNHKPLQSVDSADQKLWTKYTYNCQNGTCGDGYPLIDFGGKAVIIGPSYDPTILKGLTQKQIIKDLSDPSNQVTKAVLGTANYMTAAMCMATQNQPSSVCTPQITKLSSSFPTWKPSSSAGSSANSSSSSSG